MTKQNYFPTLSQALESEGIDHMWPGTPIQYGQTASYTFNDGSKYGHFITVYRDERGFYERPVHYARG